MGRRIADNYVLSQLAELTDLGARIVVLPFVDHTLAANPVFTRSIDQLRHAGVRVLFGPGEFEPHPPHTGGQLLDDYPWQQRWTRHAPAMGEGSARTAARGMMTPMASSYREQPAPAALAGVVACLWRHEVRAVREQRVLPDGCMDLIWMNGSVYVAGPDTRAFLTTPDPGQVITGLRFRPGAAPAVLGVPAHVLRDRRLRLDELWPGTTLPEQVAEAPDPGTALVAALACRIAAPDQALAAVLAQLRTGSGVAATADALGWTERTLHRRCRDAFGYGPSVLRRILRFRMALRLAGQGVPFAITATRAGYADQAHLAREVRALSGVPLSQLISIRRAEHQRPTHRTDQRDTAGISARHAG